MSSATIRRSFPKSVSLPPESPSQYLQRPRPVSLSVVEAAVAHVAGWVAACFCLLLLTTGCSDRGKTKPPAKAVIRADASWPNIVLISVDSLRPDHLSCYRYARQTSPRIDRLAGEGTLFENTISSTSWTLPAHAAMFTGLADSVHGCLDMDQALDDSRETLAERLGALGYTTIGFFSGPAMHPAFGIGQGFAEYVDCTSFPGLTAKVLSAGQSLDGGVVESSSSADVTNPRTCERVALWLKQNDRRPFFMFIHLWDVHFDYIPPPPYDRMFDPDYVGLATGENIQLDPAVNANMPTRDLAHIIALYDGEIAWTDHHIGMILDELDALKLRDSTIVMLTADHGEEFFEHGDKTHRKTLFDEVIRVPLIVRCPGRIPAGRRIGEQVRVVDLLPTLLELAGAPPPTDVMGQSLVPVLSGGKPPKRELAISELFSVGRQLRSFRSPDRKMIVNEKTAAALYFNLQIDPRESTPLREPLGDANLKRLIDDSHEAERWLAEHRGKLPQVKAAPKLPDTVRKQLESLGYIGSKKEGGNQAGPGR